MLEQFLSKSEFNSYDEFYNEFNIKVPDNFNFAYDVVDTIAKESPDKIAPALPSS